MSAIEDPNPVLYFEHKHLYRRIKAEVPDERYLTPFGKARVHREGDDITVVTWGAMVYTAEEAAKQLEEEDLSIEILDLRTLIPWDRKAVLESAQKTSKVLVLHEDTRTGGFGAGSLARSPRRLSASTGPSARTARTRPVPFSPRSGECVHPACGDSPKTPKLAEY